MVYWNLLNKGSNRVKQIVGAADDLIHPINQPDSRKRWFGPKPIIPPRRWNTSLCVS
jgi:hypothetical protein